MLKNDLSNNSSNNFSTLRETVPLSSILKKYQEEVGKIKVENKNKEEVKPNSDKIERTFS